MKFYNRILNYNKESIRAALDKFKPEASCDSCTLKCELENKDIFSDSNNKTYSPQTCCLVPRYINDVIRKRNKTDLPNGVSKN